ncbi:MAG: bifunctional sulfate adenylyltransferase/adenylylsulfate kinase [Nitrospirae bacterium]|nr:bifunctional sulfate adenylyltransferase/adenylylsulfate kinase [Nitrospirota bacterium]
MSHNLVIPHGGNLVSLVADSERAESLRAQSKKSLSWDMTSRQICDLELLLEGGFSPLKGFMGPKDYESVCDVMRLTDGTVWPIPIVLDIPEHLAKQLAPGEVLSLRDPEGIMLAAMTVEEIWQPDRSLEAQRVYGTTSLEHPGVAYLLDQTHPFYVSGKLEGVRLPIHYDFGSLRYTPQELRKEFSRLGWRRVVAFQTRNVMHRAHYALTLRAAKNAEANLLIHPVVGLTKPGDVDHYTRVRCYQALLPRYPSQTVKLALLPLAMRMAGPREAVWHAIIRKNYGCTHFIVGRDHAGPGKDAQGREFYSPYAAQELFSKYEEEMGMVMVPFQEMVYLEDRDEYVPLSDVPDGSRVLSLSGTELRRRLAEGGTIPQWFTYPEVAQEVRRTHPPRHHQGFSIFFTGLSGSGKSTIANVILVKLMEMGGRPVTLLDGDIVRKHLSSELGFSKEHRDINIRRIGYVAAEISKNGGVAICAPIAPYEALRKEVRQMVETSGGGFVLVHINTPLEVCEARDRKGLYAKARAGIIQQFTGISDPYESPKMAEVVIDTTDRTPEEAAQEIILYLEKAGFIGSNLV